MPTVTEAAARLRHAYQAGWFSPDTREDIGTILDCIDRETPLVPTVAYALEPGKHYVMAYDTAAVSSCMLKALSEGFAGAGIHVFMVGIHGTPKGTIAFAPTARPPSEQNTGDEGLAARSNADINYLKKKGAVPGFDFPEVVSSHPFLDYARKYYKERKERKETK